MRSLVRLSVAGPVPPISGSTTVRSGRCPAGIAIRPTMASATSCGSGAPAPSSMLIMPGPHLVRCVGERAVTGDSFLVGGRDDAFRDSRGKRARLDDRHVDTRSAELVGVAFGQALQGPLGRGVGTSEGNHDPAHDAGDVYQQAGAGLAHRRQHRAVHTLNAEQVDLEQPSELLDGERLGLPADTGAGVVGLRRRCGPPARVLAAPPGRPNRRSLRRARARGACPERSPRRLRSSSATAAFPAPDVPHRGEDRVAAAQQAAVR